MIVHTETLYHFQCDRNPNHFWAIADKERKVGQIVYCPECGHPNKIEGIQSHSIAFEPNNSGELECVFKVMPLNGGAIEEVILKPSLKSNG